MQDPATTGGDGFVVARYLVQMGVKTEIFIFAPKKKITGHALANLTLLETLIKASPQGTLTEILDMDGVDSIRTEMAQADIMVDALLGTGLNSDVRGLFKTVIERVNALACPVLSIDIPSGLNADTGTARGTAIKAHATATFAFAKAGHFLFPGKALTGRLRIIDIGIPPFISDPMALKLRVVEHWEVAELFAPRAQDAHKGDFGHLLVIAGSTGKTGAAALAANAAMAMGAGLVTLGVAASLNPVMEIKVTEPMTVPLEESTPGHLSDTALTPSKPLHSTRVPWPWGPAWEPILAHSAWSKRSYKNWFFPW